MAFDNGNGKKPRRKLSWPLSRSLIRHSTTPSFLYDYSYTHTHTHTSACVFHAVSQRETFSIPKSKLRNSPRAKGHTIPEPSKGRRKSNERLRWVGVDEKVKETIFTIDVGTGRESFYTASVLGRSRVLFRWTRLVFVPLRIRKWRRDKGFLFVFFFFLYSVQNEILG